MSHLDEFSRLTDVAWRKSFESEHGLFIAEGLLTIERALAAGLEPRTVLTSPKFEGALRRLLPYCNFEVHPEKAMEALTGFHVHRGALASFERPPARTLAEMPEASLVVVLDDLVDHENVGTIMRSAAALGVDAVVLSETCADPLYRRSIKTSMGAVFSVPWFRGGSATEILTGLRQRGYEQWALTPSGTINLRSAKIPEQPLALWLGNEGDGLSVAVLSEVDQRIAISMSRDVDSINVAAAAAVAFWALSAHPKPKVNREELGDSRN